MVLSRFPSRSKGRTRPWDGRTSRRFDKLSDRRTSYFGGRAHTVPEPVEGTGQCCRRTIREPGRDWDPATEGSCAARVQRMLARDVTQAPSQGRRPSAAGFPGARDGRACVAYGRACIGRRHRTQTRKTGVTTYAIQEIRCGRRTRFRRSGVTTHAVQEIRCGRRRVAVRLWRVGADLLNCVRWRQESAELRCPAPHNASTGSATAERPSCGTRHTVPEPVEGTHRASLSPESRRFDEFPNRSTADEDPRATVPARNRRWQNVRHRWRPVTPLAGMPAGRAQPDGGHTPGGPPPTFDIGVNQGSR